MARRGAGAAEALPDPRAAARQFERAAATFAAASFVHDEARTRLLERLEYLRVREDGLLIDLGSGPGAGALALARRFPAGHVLAIDRSPAMLRAVRARGLAAVAGDAEHLPLAEGSAALVLANLVLPWCRPDAFFAEVARVLAPDGVLLFATLGPDTLTEVRRAFGRDDPAIHVHGCFDMHDLGDLALAAGLEEPVMSVEQMTVTYADIAAIVRDLRACGATNVAPGRRATLTGPARWRAFERALEATRRDGRLAVTVELVFGQAFGRSAGRRAGPERNEVAVPLSAIRRGPAAG